MGIRRQIYLDDQVDRLLAEQSRQTGLSVSELIRRAVRDRYSPARALTWTDVFARGVTVGTARPDGWPIDPLFDRFEHDEA